MADTNKDEPGNKEWWLQRKSSKCAKTGKRAPSLNDKNKWSICVTCFRFV